VTAPAWGAICQHAAVNAVTNAAGKVIGGQCRYCLCVVYGVGTCEGCGRLDARLRVCVDGHRFCDDGCKKVRLDKARAERELAKARPGTRLA
jgi:hypothetical protein